MFEISLASQQSPVHHQGVRTHQGRSLEQVKATKPVEIYTPERLTRKEQKQS